MTSVSRVGDRGHAARPWSRPQNLTSAWSAASSVHELPRRALYGLAVAGNAPVVFLRGAHTNRSGLPWVALIFSTAFAFLAFMVFNRALASLVFGWFANMTAVAGLTTWFDIVVTYIRFYASAKAQDLDRGILPYSSKLQPFAAWYATIFWILISIFNGWSVFLKDNWDTATFVTNYLPLILFPILYIGAKWWKRTSLLLTSELDLHSGLAEIEADTYDDPPPKNKWDAFWQWLM